MDLQIKLDNVFKRLVEIEDRFGAHNKFISLSVRNLDGSTSTDENSGKIYLGILKFYNITGNHFETVDLFIKIEPRTRGEEGLIKYDFKFYNEYVAYKHILPVLNKSFANRIGGEPRSVPKRFSEQADNAYTIEEFTNDVRYREVGKLSKREYRHSWNSFDKMKTEMKFYTIRPNSRFAVDKCATYEKHVSHGAVANEILKLFPKFYHGEVGDGGTDNILVIENMLRAGFHTDNEGLFLEKDRILLTLKTLGKFHSSSYIAKANNREEFQRVVDQLKATGWTLPEYWDIYPNFINQHLQRGIEFLKTDKHYQHHVHKFDKILQDPKAYFFKLIKPNDMSVICHGDFCKNNILYKYENTSDVVGNENRFDREVNSDVKNDMDYQQVYIQKKSDKLRRKESEEKQKSTARLDDQIHKGHLNQDFYKNNLILFHNKVEPFKIKTNDEEVDKYQTFLDNFLESEKWEKEGHSKKEVSSPIDDKRKEFLHHLLETPADHIPSKTISKNSQNSMIDENMDELLKTKEGSPIKGSNHAAIVEIPVVQIENKNINGLNCFENEGFRTSEIVSGKYGKRDFINTYEDKCSKCSPSENQIFTEDSRKNYTDKSNVKMSNHGEMKHELKNNTKNIKAENKTDLAISDRLKYLEDRYKQLEKIYNVNQCVLERRRVNLQIIEKLNEKKQILEDICKKIEKISQKHRMESKFHSSITKLYQNMDDLDTKQSSSQSLSKASKVYDSKRENKVTKVESTEAQKTSKQIECKERYTYNSAEIEEKTSKKSIPHTNTYSSVIDQTRNKKLSITRNVEEEFDNLYKETFTEDNSKDYEGLFNELTKKMDFDGKKLSSAVSSFLGHYEDKGLNKISSKSGNSVRKGCAYWSNRDDVQNKTLKPNKINVGHKQGTEDTEYETLSVKQRRDNLERSISLSNELKSFDQKQSTMKRSSSDINQLRLNNILVSERNIFIDQTGYPDREKESMKEALLRSLQAKTRPRIFTESSLSLNEYEEMSNDDDVFFDASDNIKETNSLGKKKLRKEYNENFLRSSSCVDIGKNQTRPVPMKRTISLIEELATDTKKKNEPPEVVFNKDGFQSASTIPRTRRDINAETKRLFFLGSNSEPEINSYKTTYTQNEQKTPCSFTQFQNRHSATTKNQTTNAQPILFGTNKSHTNTTKRQGKESDSPTFVKKDERNSNASIQYKRELKALPSYLKPSKQGPKSASSVDIVFFDLARTIYCSPVIDLSFFLFLNVSSDLRANCWDEFISTYYTSLRAHVPGNVPIPSFLDLVRELGEKSVYGYFLCCFFLPWMMEERPREDVAEWIHHGGQAGTEAIADILKFLIDRDFV
ncbi:hypothetical protein M8J77_018505 [Diaphorina citri]|nr:hypothetical protein M8J77_018505 [Diaphorina citri]